MLTKARIVEESAPFGIAIFMAILVWKLSIQPPPVFTDLVGVSINVSGIAIAFIASAKAMLFSMPDNRLMKALKENRMDKVLMRYFMSAIIWGFILCLLGAGCYLADWKKPSDLAILAFRIWVGLSVLCLALCLRIIRLFSMIITGP